MSQPWPADAVVRRPLASLVPYAKNARTHSSEQIAQLARLISAYGWTNPVLVDRYDTLIAGHGRVLAAQLLGLAEVPVMVADGWTAEQIKAYRLADNASAAQAGWDDEALKFELGELDMAGFDLDLTGFRPDQLAGLLDVTEGLTDPDDVPEVPAVPVTQPGDVWIMGRHRLVCGDATKDSHVSHTLAGVRPHLMVTDPPYGVEYDAEWRSQPGVAVSLRHPKPGAVGKVTNDGTADWSAAWALFPGDVAYVWHGALRATEAATNLDAAGFEVRSQIVWIKNQSVIGRGHYHWQHEPCWYAVRKSSTGHWQGDRKQTTVWQIDKPLRSEAGHSTQKPVECMKRPIENNSSPGQAVYEPFSGSGTTIIAAEMTGRSCHALEISPAYVDVAVLRWQAFSGQSAVLERTGQSFEQTANFPSINAHEPEATPAD
jgi:DNA modification methylase